MIGFADFSAEPQARPGLDPGAKPEVVEVKPVRVKRARKVAAADEDELGLVGAK